VVSTPSSERMAAMPVRPKHVAVIMDGNGRWAKKRFLPRIAGHRGGVEALRGIISACVDRGIEFLTVFAFSSENWRRPEEEVTLLRQLFLTALQTEVEKMHRNGIRLRTIGDLKPFGEKVQKLAEQGELLTRGNNKLTLTIAANYGGRWDLLQAFNRVLLDQGRSQAPIGEEDIEAHLSLNYAPDPDLFIRTGGEQRISNFMLWNLAYTELYFTETLWPDFDEKCLDEAIRWFSTRERRFGRTSEQVLASSNGDSGVEPLTARGLE
jgi:undecaprenyl diphosphate synthase